MWFVAGGASTSMNGYWGKTLTPSRNHRPLEKPAFAGFFFFSLTSISLGIITRDSG